MSKVGEFHLYLGAMGVGKTDLLCRRFEEEVGVGKSVLVIKPTIDNRTADNNVVQARTGRKVPCISVSTLDEIELDDLKGIDLLLIDEIQFFDDVLDIECIFDFNMEGVEVIGYGLDMNYLSEDFGVMGLAMARADAVFKVSAKCNICGENPVRFTAKMNDLTGEEIEVGDIGDYMPMCKPCFKSHMMKSYQDIIVDNVLSNYKPVPHPTLKNVIILEEDLALVSLGGEDYEFDTKVMVKPSVLEQIGWRLEDVADIIDVDALNRLLDEVKEITENE